MVSGKPSRGGKASLGTTGLVSLPKLVFSLKPTAATVKWSPSAPTVKKNGLLSDCTLSLKDRRRNASLLRKYGISLFQFEAILRKQNGKCGVCQKFFQGLRRMYVDHDHKTGVVRGVLDYTCNMRLLGRGLDRPELHEAAAAYLRSGYDGRKEEVYL